MIAAGRFSFVLPMDSGSAAMPSRLAMEIQGKLMEGEVVNRSKAQRVYRDLDEGNTTEDCNWLVTILISHMLILYIYLHIKCDKLRIGDIQG